MNSIGHLSFSQAQLDLIREWSSAGLRWNEIAKRLGRPYNTVAHLAKRLGLTGQGKNRFPKGALNPSWQGGRYIDLDGYVHALCPGHPFAHGKGYVLEHRLVMERKLGRILKESEVVHHKDKNRQNNSLENLQLFDDNADHLRHELTGHIPKWSEGGKRQIHEGILRSSALRHQSSRVLKENGGSCLQLSFVQTLS